MKWWQGAFGTKRDGGEQKDIMPWRDGQVMSTENGNNFTTNQVTVADAMDILAAKSGTPIGLSSTWACVQLLAGTISTLPLQVHRTNSQGVKTVARTHPLYWVLHDSPNFDQTAVDFWEYEVAGIELQGNAFALIKRGVSGDIVSLTPLRPDTVHVRRLSSGLLQYRYSEGGEERLVAAKDMLHIRGPMGDALSGASTLAVCRPAFDNALHADRASSHIFANGIQPSGILSTDREVSLSPEQREKFDDYLHARFKGARNAGRPLLLDRGMTWTQINLKPEDAQMLETRQFGVEEICRIFGVPPHMIGHTSNSTSWGTGLEQQTLGFVKFSLRRRLKRIEMALEKQLLTPADRAQGISIEFNLEGLLRGDTQSRANFYQSGLQNGWRTINEVRALENLPPVEGGDIPRMQSQNVPLNAPPPTTETPGEENAA